MKALITLMMMFNFAAGAQTHTQFASHRVNARRSIFPTRCFFIEKTSGRVPQNTILYPESQSLFPLPNCTNGVYIYQKNITSIGTNVVVVGSIAITNVFNRISNSDVFYEGTNRFEHKGSMIYVCGDEFVQIRGTNIVIEQTEDSSSVTKPNVLMRPSQLTEEEKKVFEERRNSLQEYKANTNLLSVQELEAKGIKIMFREVLSIEMIEVVEGGYDGYQCPMVVRRWIPCSDPIGKPIARIDTY